MAITSNTSKPITSLANITKTMIGLIWSLDLNTWATETQTWGDTASTIDNITKQSSSITNISKPA